MADTAEIITSINRDQGYDALILGSEWKYPDVPRISTGSLSLDWATNGGIPIGRITEIYGREGSGKSAICSKIVAQAQKKGMTCVWIDAENSYDPEWMKKLGVDVDSLIVSVMSEGEEVLDLMMKLVSFGHPRDNEYKDYPKIDLVVCDSVAALAPMKILEDEMEQAQMAVEARMMNKGVKRINARCSHTAVVFVNQVRTGFGRTATDVTPGGRGLSFFAGLRVEVRAGDWIKQKDVPGYLKINVNGAGKDDPIGHIIRCRTRKSKVGPPYREANFDFFYNGRIDPIKDIIAAAKISEVVEQAGAFYKYNGESFRGAKAFADFLKDDREALRDIRKQVLSTI